MRRVADLSKLHQEVLELLVVDLSSKGEDVLALLFRFNVFGSYRSRGKGCFCLIGGELVKPFIVLEFAVRALRFRTADAEGGGRALSLIHI